MKLTIDTQADSKEEIQKAIQLLQGLVSGQEVRTNDPAQYDSQEPSFDAPETGNLMELFDTTNVNKKPGSDPDIPQVEFF